MIAACLLCGLASLARAEPPAAGRRLDAVQVGWVHEKVDREAGDAAMFSLETGRTYGSRLGVAGLVRLAKYDGSRYSTSKDDDRVDLLIGPRVYVEVVPDRLLFALGTGAMISFGKRVDDGPHGQPFLEAYAGVRVGRLDSDELEVGILGGIAPEEDAAWFGLAVALRRRAW